MILLYGVIKSGVDGNQQTVLELENSNIADDIKLYNSNGIALIASEVSEGYADNADKHQLYENLLSYQKTLEDIMALYSVIPVKFGTVVPEIEDVWAILALNSGLFSQALNDYSDVIEISLTVMWDLQEQLKQISENNQRILYLKSTLSEDKLAMAVGKLLAEEVEAKKINISDQIYSALDALALKRKDHQSPGDDIILSCSYMISKTLAGKLDEVIEKLNQQFEDRFTFKLLAPLPLHSFCNIQLEHFSKEELQDLYALFNIKTNTTIDLLQQEYREIIRHSHPDLAGAIDFNLSKVNKLFKRVQSFFRLSELPFKHLDKNHCYVSSIASGKNIKDLVNDN